MAEIRLGEYVFTLATVDGKPAYSYTQVEPFSPQIIQSDINESSLPPELTPYSFRNLSDGYGQSETPLNGENTRFDRMGDAAGEGVDATLTPEGPMILSAALNTFSLTPAGTSDFVGALQNTGTVSHFTAGRYVYKWTGAALTNPGDIAVSPTDRITPYMDVTGTEYWYVPLGGGTTAKYSTDSGATWTSIGTGGGVDKVFSFAVVDGVVMFAGPSPRSGQAFLAQFDDGGVTPTLFGVIDPVGNPARAISRLMEYNGRVVVLKQREGIFLLTSDRRDLSQNLLPDLPTSGAVLYHHGATNWRGLLWVPTGQTVVTITPSFSVRYLGPDVTTNAIQTGVHGVIQALAGDAYNLYAFLYTSSTTASWIMKANVTVSNSQVEKIAWFPFLQLSVGLQCQAMSTVGGVNSSSRTVTDILIGNVNAAGNAWGVYRIRCPRQGRDPRADPDYTYTSAGTLYYSRNTKRFPAIPAQWYGQTPLCLDLGYQINQITPTTAQSIQTWYKEDTVPLVSTPPYGYTRNTAQTTGVGTRDTLTDLAGSNPRSIRARGLDTAIRLTSSAETTTPQVSSVTLDYMPCSLPVWQHIFTIDLTSGATETGGMSGMNLLTPDQAIRIVRGLPGTATTLSMAIDQPDVVYSVAIPNSGITPEVAGQAEGGFGGPGGYGTTTPFRFTIRAVETTPATRVADTQLSYLQEVMADSPIGYWRVGEISGTAAADSSSTGNNGTYTAGYTLNQTGALMGDSNAAVELNGTTGYVTIPDNAAYDLTSFTLEAWVKTANAGAGRVRIVSQQNAGNYWILSLSANVLELGSSIDSILTTKGSALNNSQWHHVATVLDRAATLATWYVDGEPIGTAAALGAGTTGIAANPTIGSSSGAAEFYAGTVDEVAVYNTALSAARIRAHYQAGSTVR